MTKKPDHLQIASGLGLKPPVGAHAVDVAIDVELEQIGWVVTGASGGLRLHPGKARLLKVEPIDKGVDEANRIVGLDVVVHPCGEELRLIAVEAFNVVHGDE